MLPFHGLLALFQVVGVPYIIGAVGTAEHVNVVSQSGAILVHFIAPCDPQAQSFDRLRMKGWGARSLDRAQDEGLGAQSFDRLRMMVGGSVLRQAQDEE